VSATVLYMSMSLEGFIAGPNEGPDNGLGDGGHRLHQWSPDPEPDRNVTSGYLAGINRQVHDEAMVTGAVVAGRGTVEPAGFWGGDHHDGVPIFIFTRRDPRRDASVAARQLRARCHQCDDSSKGGRR
jgi:dihydrofolate reductase